MTIEELYPITFRKDDAQQLGTHLKNRHSVMLVGMKRVGISNFLRFFLSHKEIQNIYINDGRKHLFVTIDLNDLVEKERYPFWVLTFKRIADAVEESSIDEKSKKHIA